MLLFSGGGILASQPNPKLGDNPMLDVRDELKNENTTLSVHVA